MKVDYLDHMSSDLGVVNAARVSFDKTSSSLTPKDERLINYLAEHHHWLPFRHPTVMFRCKAPIFLARQTMKHQVGMSWSEVSRRYVDSEPEFYAPDVWRKRADDKKQGSSDETVDWLTTGKAQLNIGVHDAYQQFEKTVSELYHKMLKADVAPEQARMVLPQSMYTEWVWTGSLLSWTHFVKQRTDTHAQKEIQDFANLFIPHLESLYPVSWKALMENYNP